MPTLFIKKIVIIILYIVILTILWMTIRNRYGEIIESFKTSSTLLRNIPEVNLVAQTYVTLPYSHYVKERFSPFQTNKYYQSIPQEQIQIIPKVGNWYNPSLVNNIHYSDYSPTFKQIERYCGGTENRLRERFCGYKLRENFDNSTGEVTKSFGTLLRSVPQVNQVAKKFMSVQPQKFKAARLIELPKNLDGRDIWKEYLTPISEQGQCGNCWAHASTSSLADRFAILSLGQIKFIPSPYEITICAHNFTNIKNQWGNVEAMELMDDYLHGAKVDPAKILQSASCEGAALYTAANILYTDGVPDTSCFPVKGTSPPLSFSKQPLDYDDKRRKIAYDVNNTKVGETQNLPYCHNIETMDFDTCVDQTTPIKKYRAKTAYNVGQPYSDNPSDPPDTLDELEKAIMHEIYRYGPIASGFMVFNDFMDPSQYTGKTIYQHKGGGSSQGGHAIRIVGWGEETVNGELIPYWIIANSWGTQWGLNGFFKFKRKIIECELEKNALAMLPDFPGMIVQDEDIVPIETAAEVNVRNFTDHYLDPNSGYYTSGLKKIENCKLTNDPKPYLPENASVPDFSTFYAAEIKEYIQSKPLNITTPSPPLVTCSSGGTPSTPSSRTPTPTPPPSVITPSLQTASKKVCITSTDNKLTKVLDTVAKKKFVLDILYGLLLTGGVFGLWKFLADEVPITITPSVETTPTPTSSSVEGLPEFVSPTIV